MQVDENTAKINRPCLLTTNIQWEQNVSEMKKAQPKPKIMPKIAIVPTAEEMAIVDAGRRKHGLKNASEIIRMALRRFAESEGISVA